MWGCARFDWRGVQGPCRCIGMLCTTGFGYRRGYRSAKRDAERDGLGRVAELVIETKGRVM